MKKSLLSAFVIASVLAFSACKKEEGPVGPKGDTGAPGAPGAAGPVGPQGAAGKDGTVIRSGEGAPASGLGVVGDYYFDKTAKSLYGPKTAEGWGTETSLQGPAGTPGQNGQDGQDGANGTSFTAGAGVPTDAIGSEGDWYFDTNTSTFYGPKTATGWAAGNVLPLGSAFAAQTYHIIRGFDNVKEVTKVYAQKLEESYTDYTLLSSYKVSEEDKRRFDNYSKWHENREMIFETTPNSGIFNRVPRGAFDFAGSGVAVPAGLGASYGITVGANFKYTNAPMEEANHTYTLLAEDIARLSVNNGAAFTYLTYAATKPENVVIGEYLTFYQKKALNLVDDTEKYYATYTSETNLDVNQIVPKLEKWKKEGAYVFVGYNYYEDLIGTNTNQLVDNYSTGSRGYYNITDHVLTYVNANVAYGQNNEFSTGAGNIIGTNTTGTANMNHSNNPFAGHLMNTSGTNKFGSTSLTIAANQVATPTTAASETHYVNGKLNIKWNITSGTAGTHTLNIDPLTLTNPSGLTMENLLLNPTWESRTWNREYYTPPRLTYGFNTTTYPVANSTTTHTWVPAWGWIPGYWSTVTGATGIQNVKNNNGGQPASYFDDINLLRLTINVVPAEVVKSAKAAGVNVNNPEALINFAKSLQLQ